MPVKLVQSLLAHHGAEVESLDDQTMLALLPEKLGEILAVPEEIMLGIDGQEGLVNCGYGSEMLRGLIDHTLQEKPVVALDLQIPVPPLREPVGFTGLNVALRHMSGTYSSVWTLIGYFLLDAVADDRQLSTLEVTMCLTSMTLLDPIDWMSVPHNTAKELLTPKTLKNAYSPFARAVMDVAQKSLSPFRASVARRYRRDRLRVDQYFREMDEDLYQRINRYKNPKGLIAKRAGLPLEMSRRLQTLEENYRINAHIEPIGLALVKYPVSTARLLVLRRKKERKITLRFDPLLRQWHPLACEFCSKPVKIFGACDESVHILCSDCLERSGKSCPCCKRKVSKRKAPERLVIAPSEEPVSVPSYQPGSPLENMEAILKSKTLTESKKKPTVDKKKPVADKKKNKKSAVKKEATSETPKSSKSGKKKKSKKFPRIIVKGLESPEKDLEAQRKKDELFNRKVIAAAKKIKKDLEAKSSARKVVKTAKPPKKKPAAKSKKVSTENESPSRQGVFSFAFEKSEKSEPFVVEEVKKSPSTKASTPKATVPKNKIKRPEKSISNIEKKLLEVLTKYPIPLKSKQLQFKTGYTAKDLRGPLKALIDGGLVLRTGKGPGTEYKWVGKRG